MPYISIYITKTHQKFSPKGNFLHKKFQIDLQLKILDKAAQIELRHAKIKEYIIVFI